MYFPQQTQIRPKVTILEGQNVVLQQHFQLWVENEHTFAIFTKNDKMMIYVKIMKMTKWAKMIKIAKTHFSAPGRKCCSSTSFQWFWGWISPFWWFSPILMKSLNLAKITKLSDFHDFDLQNHQYSVTPSRCFGKVTTSWNFNDFLCKFHIKSWFLHKFLFKLGESWNLCK